MQGNMRKRPIYIGICVLLVVIVGVGVKVVLPIIGQERETGEEQESAVVQLGHTIFGLTTEDGETIVPASYNLEAVSTLPGQVVLRWTNEQAEVTGYRVYRDDEFLGVVDEAHFGDTDTIAGRTYSYSILALNASNQISAPTTLRVSVQNPVVANPVTNVVANTNTPTNTTVTPIVPPSTNTNAPTNANSNTAHVAQTVDVHVTQDEVQGASNITISVGDRVRFIYDGTDGELIIRFSPSTGLPRFTLDAEHTTKTVDFMTAGIYTFSAAEDDQDLRGTITVQAL